MDEFPGVMFEPGSLHKYLYCSNKPIDRYDPSGLSSNTILEWCFMIGVYAVLLTAVWAGSGWLGHFIMSAKEMAEWKGEYIVHTFGLVGWSMGWAIAWFTGTHSTKKPKYGKGYYLMILTGLALSSPINFAKYSATVYTPGLWGASPWTLVGPATWVSGSFLIGPAIPDIMGSSSHFIIGLGVSSKEWGEGIGLDVGFEIMGGLSLPIWLDPWPWETE
jgi:hypothetical protein